MTHEQSIQFLRVVSMIGMVVFNVFIVFLAYKKLQIYYPDKVKKFRWVFLATTILLSFLMLFIFNKFYVTNQFGVSGQDTELKPKIPKLY